jgi:hypothetical protein
MDEIVNRVASSGIINLDLEDFLADVSFSEIDLADQLWQGLALREKDFREWIKNHDWTSYQNHVVAVHCSADAIVPAWAYMLISSSLSGIAKRTDLGALKSVKEQHALSCIYDLNQKDFTDSRVVVKGCGDEGFSPAVYMALTSKLQPVVKSLMYGEPCSTVPVYKRPK